MSISEDQLFNWTKPWFNNEEERATKTADIVRSTISDHPVLKNLSLRVFPKGSYANNTNVRKDSDIDIAVEFTDLITVTYRPGVSDSTTGLRPYSGISAHEFKSYVGECLNEAFGPYRVDSSGNKTFKIRGSDKIMDADVIPCTKYLDCFPYLQREGIELILNNPDGKRHINYPDQHYNNGIQKNKNTSLRFKSVVRILKNARNYLSSSYTLTEFHSFMIESLAYNIPDYVYLNGNTWKDRVAGFCVHAWDYLNQVEPVNEEGRWLEVNDIKFLFHDDQKWDRENAKQFIKQIYNLVGN